MATPLDGLAHIALITIGTRGDVQPFIALGLALKRHLRSCRVTILAPPNHRSFVTQYSGLEFHAIGIDTHEFMQLFQTGNMEVIAPRMAQMWSDNNVDAWHFCNEHRPSMIVFHQAIGAGASIAEKLDITAIEVSFAPWQPTCAFAMSMAPDEQLLKSRSHAIEYLGNMSSHLPMHEGAAYLGGARTWVAVREHEMHLAPLPVFGYAEVRRVALNIPMVHAWSKHVLPRPFDWSAEHFHCVGYWFLDREPQHDSTANCATFQPSDELAAFLDECGAEAPIYVGFGSMFSGDNARVLKCITDAIAATGQRCVLSTGWCELLAAEHTGTAADHQLFDRKSTIVVGSVPHWWLFPRMKAVVHHGGAGSTAAGVRAGVPSIVVPHIADQMSWACQLHALGVASEPIRIAQLTSERLTAAIRYLLDTPQVFDNARQLAARIRQEDGVACMIDLMCDTFSSSHGKFQGRDVADNLDSVVPRSWLYRERADGKVVVEHQAYIDMATRRYAAELYHAAVAYLWEVVRQLQPSEQLCHQAARLLVAALKHIDGDGPHAEYTSSTMHALQQGLPVTAVELADISARIRQLIKWY
jgi:sterol 3beta-glucosyltransferase